jgi:aryl-alcohol dehydrogenase-like predicted oxidoreductase
MGNRRTQIMQYRTLGRTGVQVSSLVLGAMNFGALGRTTQAEATAIVDAALEGGINLIDTADRYSRGESEEMVGKAIAAWCRPSGPPATTTWAGT